MKSIPMGQATIRIMSKNWPVACFGLICLSFRAFCFTKKSRLRRIFSQKSFSLIIVLCIWFQVFYSVYQFIVSINYSNSNAQWLQQRNLYQTVMKKVSNNKPFVQPNLVRYKSHNTISILKTLKTTYVNRGNMNDITITRFASIGVDRCCDDTVDKKRVNSCVLKHLCRGSSETKKIEKNTLKCVLISRFQKIAAGALKKIALAALSFETALRAVLNNC